MTNEGSIFSEQKVFWAACAGMLLFGMAMLSLGTVNTFLAEKFQLDQIGIGSLAALLPFGILAGSLVFGPVVDRFGYKFPLAVASVLLLAGFLMIALAESLHAIQSSFFLIGFGGGVVNGGTNALVADVSGGNKGARLSLLGVFFGIGALSVPALTGLLHPTVSLSQIIGGFGLAVFIPLSFIMAIHFPTPKQSQGLPVRQMMDLFRDKAVLLIGMTLFFESAAEGLANNWIPAYLQQAENLSREYSLFMLTLLSVSLTGGRLALGWVLKHSPSHAVLASCLVLALAGAFLLRFAADHTMAALAVVLLGLGFSAAFPVLFSYLSGLYPNLTGTAIGVALVIALIGNTVLNYTLGVVAQVRGIGIFPGYMVSVLVCLAVFMFFGLRVHSFRTSSSRT